MKTIIAAGLGIAASLAVAAAAQSDVTTATRITCVPDSVTQCSEPGKCTTRTATDDDKANVMTIDFAAKKVSMSNSDRSGGIVEDKVVDGVRRVVMTPVGDTVRITMNFTKAGKLTLDIGNGEKAAATCSIAS